jgi:hypothetical protein
MSAWPMPDMQKQVDAVREAFSADTRKAFVLKPSFPYGTPSSSHSSPPRSNFPANLARAHSLHQQLDTSVNQHSYRGHPISPPISAGPVDSKSDASAVGCLLKWCKGNYLGLLPLTHPTVSVRGWQSPPGVGPTMHTSNSTNSKLKHEELKTLIPNQLAGHVKSRPQPATQVQHRRFGPGTSSCSSRKQTVSTVMN